MPFSAPSHSQWPGVTERRTENAAWTVAWFRGLAGHRCRPGPRGRDRGIRVLLSGRSGPKRLRPGYRGRPGHREDSDRNLCGERVRPGSVGHRSGRPRSRRGQRGPVRARRRHREPPLQSVVHGSRFLSTVGQDAGLSDDPASGGLGACGGVGPLPGRGTPDPLARFVRTGSSIAARVSVGLGAENGGLGR